MAEACIGAGEELVQPAVLCILGQAQVRLNIIGPQESHALLGGSLPAPHMHVVVPRW